MKWLFACAARKPWGTRRNTPASHARWTTLVRVIEGQWRGRITLRLDAWPDSETLKGERALRLYRAAQESVRNAIQYSEAGWMKIMLYVSGQRRMPSLTSVQKCVRTGGFQQRRIDSRGRAIGIDQALIAGGLRSRTRSRSDGLLTIVVQPIP